MKSIKEVEMKFNECLQNFTANPNRITAKEKFDAEFELVKIKDGIESALKLKEYNDDVWNRTWNINPEKRIINYIEYPSALSGKYYLSDAANKLTKEIIISTHLNGRLEDYLKDFEVYKIKKIYVKSFVEKYSELVLKHGVFAGRFLEVEIRKFYKPLLLKQDIDFKKLYFYFSKNLKYFKLDENGIERSVIERMLYILYLYTLYLSYKKNAIIKSIQDWFILNDKIKPCTICNKPFKVVNLPHWVYYGTYGCNVSCLQCETVESPSKESLIDLIPKFVDVCGFIPNANYSPINPEFSSNITNEKWTGVLNAYSKIGHPEHVKKIFGSWFKAIVESGCLPNNVQVLSRGIRCLADDGHECNSLAEQRIDNWLHANNIPHEKEPYYPMHLHLNPNGKRRADWKVGETYIEYFGLAGDEGYDRKIIEKIELSRKFKFEIIPIYSTDLVNLGEVLSILHRA